MPNTPHQTSLQTLTAWTPPATISEESSHADEIIEEVQEVDEPPLYKLGDAQPEPPAAKHASDDAGDEDGPSSTPPPAKEREKSAASAQNKK